MTARLNKPCAKDGVLAYQDSDDPATFHYFPARIDAVAKETIVDYDVKYYGINAKPFFVDLGNRNYQSCVGATVSGQAVADITKAQADAITKEAIRVYKVRDVNLVPLTLQDVTVQPILAKNIVEMGGASTVTFPERLQIGTQFGFNVNSGNSLFAELVGNQGSDDRASSPDIGINFYGLAELRADKWIAEITADLSQVWEYTRTKVDVSARLGWFNLGGGSLDRITQELIKKNIVKIRYVEGGGGKEFGRQLLETTKTLFEAISAQITSGEGMFKFEPNPTPQEPPASKDSLGGDLLPWRVSVNASYVSNSFKQKIDFQQTIEFEGNVLTAFNGNMALALPCGPSTSAHFYDLQLKEPGCITKAKADGLQARIGKEVGAKDKKVKEYLAKVERGEWTIQQYGDMLALLNQINLTEAPKLLADGAIAVLTEEEALAELAEREAAVARRWVTAEVPARAHRFHRVFPPDRRKQIANTKVAPWDGVGQLVMTFPNGATYTGTATVLDATHVMTCAHNLYDADDGGRAVKVEFFPGRNGALDPFGGVEAAALHYQPDFERNPHDTRLDYAVVALKKAVPVSLTRYQVRVASDRDLRDLTVQIAGYPGDKAVGTMWCDSGRLTAVKAGSLEYKISTFRGESGAALAAKAGERWCIYGIHVGGTDEANEACRVTSAVLRAIEGWMKSSARAVASHGDATAQVGAPT